LGSDDGVARFNTPLATAHKFNGFADVWVNNGGPNGLRDLAVTLAPKVPFGLEFQLIYHKFWADETGKNLGNEIDGVLSKKLPHGFMVMTGAAYFDSTEASRAAPLGNTDLWRWSVDLNYKF
jgi:hypothetical protein